jgi:transcriptional regulator with XRE-family HTH domain
MLRTLPPEKLFVKLQLFWWKMDSEGRKSDPQGMARARTTQSSTQHARVYIAEWIEACGKNPVDLVKAEIISEGYLSLLRNGKRLNPSTAKLTQIGAFLGIEWTDLYREPPPREALDTLRGYSPNTLNRLRTSRPN